MTNLRYLGLWRNEQRPDLPDPADFIDADWGGPEKNELQYYLGSGSRGRAYMGVSKCRICGQVNGSGEFSDGTYVWPEGLVHYVAEHNVRLPAEFVTHALATRRALDEDPRDDAWWLGAMARGS